MSFHHPTTNPTTRQSILPASASSRQSTTSLQSSHQSTALQARIQAKRAELENLRQLRDLSAELAAQMSRLETKLATLRDGTESVACVLANWENVLRAIAMASSKVPGRPPPAETDAPELPVTLVRIPVQSKTEDGD